MYTASYINSVVYPQLAGGGADGEVEIIVKEPLFSMEEVLEEITLPASILSVQLTLCARDRRLFKVTPGSLPLSDEVAKPLWDLLETLGLVEKGDRASTAPLVDGHAEVVVNTGTYSATFEVPVFLDENIEQVAALVAYRALGREVSTPPRLVILDAGDRVFFEVGDSKGDSSVKLRVGESGFVRVAYSRGSGRVVGVRGIVDTHLASGVLDSSLALLIGQEDLCTKVPALAAAKTFLFAECPVLRGLLGLAARLCI